MPHASFLVLFFTTSGRFAHGTVRVSFFVGLTLAQTVRRVRLFLGVDLGLLSVGDSESSIWRERTLEKPATTESEPN
jgi:hypothetical protein